MWRIVDLILDTIFPPTCVACSKHIEPADPYKTLCARCALSIIPRNGFTCPVCGARKVDTSRPCHPKNFILGAATSYHGVPQELIRAAKYERITEAITPMAKILGHYVADLAMHHNFSLVGSIVVPIPIHPNRERRRGYNQSRILSEKLINFLGTKTSISDILIRTKDTTPQIQCVTHREREENISGAFAVRDGIDLRQYTSVILIDDVFTSGSTMCEAAKTLKKAGARRIVGLVFAKA